MSEVSKLKQQIQGIQSSAANQRKKLEQDKAPPEKFQELEASEFSAVEAIENEIDWLEGTRLFRESHTLDVDTPPLSDKENWRPEQYSTPTCITTKGGAQLLTLIDAVE